MRRARLAAGTAALIFSSGLFAGCGDGAAEKPVAADPAKDPNFGKAAMDKMKDMHPDFTKQKAKK